MTIARDKITEIFCIADDFCHIYDRFIKINGLAPKRDKSKRKYHRDSTLSDAEVTTIMILFHPGVGWVLFLEDAEILVSDAW